MKKTSRIAAEWGMELVHEGRSVFIEQNLLIRLADQSRYATQFGAVRVALLPHEGVALVAHDLAVRETRGGYHGTDKLRDLLKEWGWWTDEHDSAPAGR